MERLELPQVIEQIPRDDGQPIIADIHLFESRAVCERLEGRETTVTQTDTAKRHAWSKNFSEGRYMPKGTRVKVKAVRDPDHAMCVVKKFNRSIDPFDE